MIKEFAVNPADLAEFAQALRFLDDFNRGTGRMLTAHQSPQKWLREALRHLQARGYQDRQTRALEDRLQLVLTSKEERADLFIPQGRKQRSYDGSLSWIDATLKEHQREPFDAVIATDPRAHFSPAESDSAQPKFQVVTALDVPQSATALEEALHPLLRVSQHLHLIDPYFDPTKLRFQGVIQEILRQHPQIKDVLLQMAAIHLGGKPISTVESALRRLALPTDVTITIQALTEKRDGPKLHNRYLMTDVAGVVIDPGLDTSQTIGHLFSLNLMPLKQYLLRRQRYGSSFAFEVVHKTVFTT